MLPAAGFIFHLSSLCCQVCVSLLLEKLVGLELGKEKKEINPWGSFASARPSEEYRDSVVV